MMRISLETLYKKHVVVYNRLVAIFFPSPSKEEEREISHGTNIFFFDSLMEKWALLITIKYLSVCTCG